MMPSVSIIGDGAKYLGYAKQRLAKLEAWRRQFNQQTANAPAIVLPDALILIRCTQWRQQIIIIGTSSGSHIMLASPGASFSTYDYYKDSLAAAAEIADLSLSEKLSSLYNQRCQVGELAQVSYNQGWSGALIGGNKSFLGGINDYEMGLFYDGNDIYGRIGDAIGNIASVPDTFLPDYAKPYGALFGLSAYKATPAWNLFRGLILYTLNPANQNVQDSWYWTPSFFAAETSNGYGLIPGFYYGKFPVQEYGEIGIPLDSASVSLKAVMETKATSGDYNYGWAELVRSIDGVAINDLHVYLQATALPVPSNPNFASLLVTTTTSNPLITIGSTVQGFESSFSVPVGAEEPEVDLWNFNRFTNPDAILPDQDTGVCLAVVSGSDASFYRFTGYLSTVYTTTTYHSHARSNDGKILAVFESDDGNIITGVQVFDLHGTREASDGAEYSSGGFTQLRIDGDVVSAEAVTGCLIPYRAEGFEPTAIAYDLASAAPSIFEGSDYTDYMPSLSILQFSKEASGPIEIKKVVCLNGVDATYGTTQDECFQSQVVIEDPDVSTVEEKLVGQWDEGGTIKGKIRGNFTGDHPNMRFNGVGSGEIVTLPDTFSLSADTDTGIVTFGNYVGDLILGNCIVEDGSGGYEIDPGCDASCGSIELTASSSCGQGASATITGTTPEELALSGSTDPVVGDIYTASGGVAPYVYSITSPATIDSSTGEITAMTYCQDYTITVTDACGSTAEITTSHVYGAPTSRTFTKTSTWCSDDTKGYCYVQPFDPFLNPLTSTQISSCAWSYRNDSTIATKTSQCPTGILSVASGSLYYQENWYSYKQSGKWWWTSDFIERPLCP